MRNFSVIELIDYAAFQTMEAYNPFTIYYWRERASSGGESPGDWSSHINDILGGAVMLDYGDPLMLMNTRVIKEIVGRQEYGSGGGDGGGTPVLKARTLFSEQWNQTGTIAGKGIGNCFLPGSAYTSATKGSISVVDGYRCLIGPSNVIMDYAADDFSLSEPLVVYMGLKQAEGLFDQTTTAITLQFGEGTDDEIKIYGSTMTGEAIIKSKRSWNGLTSEKTETLTGLPNDLAQTLVTVIVSANEVQVSIGDKRMNHSGFILPNQPDLKNFRYSTGGGVQVAQVVVERLTKPSIF